MKGLESANPGVEELEYCRYRDSRGYGQSRVVYGGTRLVQGNPGALTALKNMVTIGRFK